LINLFYHKDITVYRGKYIRHNIKTRIEQVHALDIRKINLSQEGVTIIIRPDGSQVTYRIRNDSVHLESHQQVIKLETTPCHYGGKRYWFLCPHCSKRVAVLYERNKLYRCRHCHNLPYTSQRVQQDERLRIKTRKIRDRLEASHNLAKPVMFKPKGMHWNTFDRLKMTEKYANYRSLAAAVNALHINIDKS
jgi:hypothetical protein